MRGSSHLEMNAIKEVLLSPYELLLKEIERGNLDPFNVNLEYLIKLFQEKTGELRSGDYFIEAGLFLQAVSRLLKLKVQTIFSESNSEKRKITIKEVKKVLGEAKGEGIDTLDWLYIYTPQVGRPKGKAGVEKSKRISLEGLFQNKPLLHRSGNIDWKKEVERVYKEIKKGVFKIRNWIDLIAFLYAYMEDENFEIRDIREFL